MGSCNLCAWLTLLHTMRVSDWQSLYPSSQRVWECEQLLFSHSIMSESVTQWTVAHRTFLSFTISNSCPLSWWCHPTLSSSVVPFGSCLQSFLTSGSFPMSWLFASGGQSPGVSASASVLPMIFNLDFIQDWQVWSPCCPTDSQESSPAPQLRRHQFFSAQPFLLSNSHICTWLLEKP